ncbi:hypothetical protein IAR50_003142 [Cryptococcus sp. DSM 104548]
MLTPGSYTTRSRARSPPAAPDDAWVSDNESEASVPLSTPSRPRTPRRRPLKSTPTRQQTARARSPIKRGSVSSSSVRPRKRIDDLPTTLSPRHNPSPAFPPIEPPPALAELFPPPTLDSTLRYMLAPLRLVMVPVNMVASPFIAHLVNALILAAMAWAAWVLVVPLLPGLLWRLFRGTMGSVSGLGVGQLGISEEIMRLPLTTLATPTCAFLGFLCPHSFFTTPSSYSSSSSSPSQGSELQARPFWHWFSSATRKEEVDIGEAARVLTKEVQRARDIFDSVRLVGEEGVAPMEYVRVWELGSALMAQGRVDAESHKLGSMVIELGDDCRDLVDEISYIDSKSVNDFGWIQWEFERLVHLLSSTSVSPSPTVLAAKVHSLLLSLSSTLDDLHSLTSKAAQNANVASAKGRKIGTKMKSIEGALRVEEGREPGWKRFADKGQKFFLGGEPTRGEILARDISLTTQTIVTTENLVRSLEATRSVIRSFRDQIGMFDASMMGFHLGANVGLDEEQEGDRIRLSPEEEVRILAEVVGGFGRSLGRAKGGGVERLEIGENGKL